MTGDSNFLQYLLYQCGLSHLSRPGESLNKSPRLNEVGENFFICVSLEHTVYSIS